MSGESAEAMITVLTTVRNGMPLLGETVASVRAQQFRDFRYLIVDDGSSDGTAEFLRQAANRDIEVIHSAPVGRGRALNLGLAHCRTKYVAILDADDTAARCWLGEMVGIMERNPDIAALSCIGMLNKEDLEENIAQRPGAYPLSPDSLLYRNPVHHSGTLLRTQVLREVGGYDEQRDCLFDYELWVRLMEHGRQVWRVDNGFVFKRIHPRQHFERRKRLHFLAEGYRMRRRVSRNLLGGRGAMVPALLFLYGLLPRVLRNWLYQRGSRGITRAGQQ